LSSAGNPDDGGFVLWLRANCIDIQHTVLRALFLGGLIFLNGGVNRKRILLQRHRLSFNLLRKRSRSG